MVASLRQEYCERRGLTLKVIPNTYVGDEREPIFQSAFKESGFRAETEKSRYHTVMVDLTRSAELIRKQLDQKWRNQLNRSERNSLTLDVSDGRDAYREFVQLYEPMLARIHMHLKDYVSGPHMGGYSPLGIGMVDLKSILETMEQANPKANIMHELDPSRNMPYTPRQTAEISKWYLQKLGYMLGTS
jgi:hypothetical protein